MRIGWLIGWAVPEDWFGTLAKEAFPDARHVVVRPSRGAIDGLEAGAPFDWVVGYSLGTLLLLGHARRAERLGRIAILAPIFSFPREEGMGGRIARAEVRILARRLDKDPARAIREFRSRAGLEDIPEARTDPQRGTGPGELAWGLAQLDTVRIDPVLPEGWTGWCGADDPLLDAERLNALDPRIIPLRGVTHHPRGLIGAFAASIGRAIDRQAVGG